MSRQNLNSRALTYLDRPLRSIREACLDINDARGTEPHCDDCRMPCRPTNPVPAQRLALPEARETALHSCAPDSNRDCRPA